MNTIKINITKDPNYGFSNLEFSEKPTTEMLQELKNNGWRYSSHFKRWYPATEEAKKNAESFAQDYYRHYTSEEQTKTIKTAESLVDLNSIENSVDAYISEYENGNFKKKKIVVPKLSEITETQKDVFIKNGIDDENEMLKMYRETYKDVLLSGEKPILVAKKQDSSVSVKDSRTVTKEATYIINDENIGY